MPVLLTLTNIRIKRQEELILQEVSTVQRYFEMELETQQYLL